MLKLVRAPYCDSCGRMLMGIATRSHTISLEDTVEWSGPEWNGKKIGDFETSH